MTETPLRSKKIIFTLGTGLRSEEDFIEILLAYGIQTVVDVRSFPRSKLPHFTLDNLREALAREGLGYVHLGRELGGFRKGGYEAYTETALFLGGIDRLEHLAERTVSVIICAEHLPWKCHRKWISRELQRRGWTVEHIIEKGKVWVPDHTEQADLFPGQ